MITADFHVFVVIFLGSALIISSIVLALRKMNGAALSFSALGCLLLIVLHPAVAGIIVKSGPINFEFKTAQKELNEKIAILEKSAKNNNNDTNKDKNNSNSTDDKLYTVLVYYKNGRQKEAYRLSDELRSSGFASSALASDLTEYDPAVVPAQRKKGSVHLFYEEQSAAPVNIVEKIITQSTGILATENIIKHDDLELNHTKSPTLEVVLY